MRLKSFSKLQAGDFDKFLTAFCKIQEAVRTGVHRTGLSPYPSWIGAICQPTSYPKEFWTIDDSLGRTIGRIGASLSVTRPREGVIGFFEVDVKHPQAEEAARELLNIAEVWLKEKRALTAIGPMNFNFWHAYRFRLNGENVSGWEPVNPPEYPVLWQKQGYAPKYLYESQPGADIAAILDQTKDDYSRLVGHGYTFRPLQPLKDFDEDLKLIYEICMLGFKDKPLFEPITLEQFRALHVLLSQKSDLSHVALDGDGQGAAFSMCFEDQGAVIFRRRSVIPAARGLGLSSALAHVAALRAHERGLSKTWTALVPVEQFTPGSERTYALYAKPLA